MSDDLPEGWTTVTVRQVIEDVQSGFASGEKDVSGGVAHLRMNNIGTHGEIIGNLVRHVPVTVAKSHYDLRAGDVLVCTTNSSSLVGKCAYFDLAGRYVFSNHLTRLRPALNVVDGRFLRWNLWLQWTRGAFDDKCKHWVNQSALPKDALLATEIVVPPLGEQRRILVRLENLLNKVGACQQRLAKITVLLKRFRQSVLTAASSGRLTADWREENPSDDVANLVQVLRAERPAKLQDSAVREDLDLPNIPGSWAWTNLRFILSPAEAFCYGVVQPGEDDPTGVYLIRAGDLDRGHVDTTALRRISRNVHREYKRSQLNGGELLVTVVGAGIGETAIAQPECAGFNIARALAKLPVREIEARYVRLWLTTGRALAWMKGDSREVARPTLNLAQLETLPIPVPPGAEQKEIVHRVQEMFTLTDQLETRLATAQSRVDRLTAALLSKAFRGELVQTEAELARQEGRDYEPASVLLERIRRERDHESKAARPTRCKASTTARNVKRTARPTRRAVMSR